MLTRLDILGRVRGMPEKIITSDCGAKKSMSGFNPHVTAAAFVMDKNMKNVLLLHRSPNVRSAPNIWAMVTGLLEHGETLNESLKRELKEEVNLEVTSFLPFVRDHYENMPGDGFHWILVSQGVLVEDLRAFTNMEPDKHDRVEIFCIDDIPQILEDCDLDLGGLNAEQHMRRVVSKVQTIRKNFFA